jgi:hypothetical protein
MKRFTGSPELRLKRSRFWQQKGGAKKRGIEWHFTFEEWVEWWGEDFERRGSGKGKLVMARFGDTGPYHPDNVRKITHGENISEAWKGRVVGPMSDEHKQKIRDGNLGKKKPTSGRRGPMPEETRQKIRETHKKKRIENQSST